MDELRLIQRILEGDEEARAWFYHAHQKRLYPIAVHFLGYRDPEAEDVVQETFLIGLGKLKEFEPNCTLYTWLAHITINLCYARLRARKRQLATLEEDLERLAAGLSVEAHAKQGQEEDHQARVEHVRRQVGRMEPNCRKIVEHRDIKGMSYAKIGKRLRLPIGTVMSRLARCREILKNMLTRPVQGGGS